MNHGILVRADSTIQAWTWGDHTCPNPIEWERQPGDQLLDLSGMSEDEQLTFIDLIRQQRGAVRDRLLASAPRVNIPNAPPPPAGHVTCLQPGYRRICHRPTEEWHHAEIVARWEANQRIAKGEKANKVIDEEFGHLTKEEKAARKGMKTADAPFPLTPMVRLVEMVRTDTDGVQTVETLRQFPFHEPVAEF